jgi:hypothetical protein
MGKIAFLPFSLGSGLLAGVIARRVFGRMWSLVDDEPPPKPEHRDVALLKLAAAVTLEGAVFALTRGLVDHQARRAYERLTGAWPGDEAPDAD